MLTNEKTMSGCEACKFYAKTFIKFLLSHIGLVSLVVGYTIIGAFTFERLEAEEELKIKRNVTETRKKVTDDIWELTSKSAYLKEQLWINEVRERLHQFEIELIRAMKNDGWDGREDLSTQQWTFAGALFYSIVLITTIGYGHISPKTTWGKVGTIFYAIPGVPLMMLCLANIGDTMAQSFRFLYWRVCCYMCTKRPKKRRKGRRSRASYRSRPPSSTYSINQNRSSSRKSVRASPRYADDFESYPNYPEKFSNLNGISAHNENLPRGQFGENKKDKTNRVKIEKENYSVLENKYALLNESKFSFDMLGNLKAASNGENRSEARQATRRNQPDMIEQSREPEILITKPLTEKLELDYRDSPTSSMPESDFYRSNIQPPSPLSQKYENEELYYDDYYAAATQDDDDVQRFDKPVPIWLGVMLVVVYIFGGAFLFSEWENWNFLDSVYFCFITLTTIGFGDFVPAQQKKKNAELSIALCAIYLLFGIALLAMSFNLVQEEVINKVKKLGKGLGIIKDEDDEDDDDEDEQDI